MSASTNIVSYHRGIGFTVVQLGDCLWRREIYPPESVKGLQTKSGQIPGLQTDAVGPRSERLRNRTPAHLKALARGGLVARGLQPQVITWRRRSRARMRRANYNRKWWVVYVAINVVLLAAVLVLSTVAHKLGWAIGVLVVLALMPVMTRMEYTMTGGEPPPGLARWLKSRE